jgi:hypothetical protein
VSFSRVCHSQRLQQPPDPRFLQAPISSTPRPSQSSLCVLTVYLRRLIRSSTLQEPRKAEAPQLRDECRSYRILAGCSQYSWPASFLTVWTIESISLQREYPRYTISDRRACTTSSLSTSSGPVSRTSLTCAAASSLSRPSAWLRARWCVHPILLCGVNSGAISVALARADDSREKSHLPRH